MIELVYVAGLVYVSKNMVKDSKCSRRRNYPTGGRKMKQFGKDLWNQLDLHVHVAPGHFLCGPMSDFSFFYWLKNFKEQDEKI